MVFVFLSLPSQANLLGEMAVLQALCSNQGHSTLVGYYGASLLEAGDMLSGEELEKDENDDPDPRGATVILVMPMYNRGALREAIEMGLSWALKVRIAHDVANGLEVLVRANIIHRDIKTTNVLIDDGWRAKLCDFNLAIDDSSSAKGDFVAGTEEFMSPEALLGEDYGFSSDIFSFGIMLFEMLCERVPGEAGFMVRSPRDMFVLDMDDLQEKRPAGAPDSLWTIATDCCDPDVDVRPDASYASSWLSDILKDEFKDDVQVPQPVSTPIQPLKDDLLDREGKQAASTRSNVRRKLLKGLRPEDVSKMRQLAQNLADRPINRRLSCDVTAPLQPSICSSQNCNGERRKTISNLPLLPSNDSNQCACRPRVENGTEDTPTLTAFQRQVNGVKNDHVTFSSSAKKRTSHDQRRLSAVSSLGTEGSSPKEGEIRGCYQSGDDGLCVPSSAESDTEETPVKRDSPSPKIVSRDVVDTERVHPRQYTRALFRRSFSLLGDQEADRIRKISLINMRASSDPLICCEGVQNSLEKVNDLISKGYMNAGKEGSEIEQPGVSQGNINSYNAQMDATAISPENCDMACSAIGSPNEASSGALHGIADECAVASQLHDASDEVSIAAEASGQALLDDRLPHGTGVSGETMAAQTRACVNSSSQDSKGKLDESDDGCTEGNLKISYDGSHDCSRPKNSDDDELHEVTKPAEGSDSVIDQGLPENNFPEANVEHSNTLTVNAANENLELQESVAESPGASSNIIVDTYKATDEFPDTDGHGEMSMAAESSGKVTLNDQLPHGTDITANAVTTQPQACVNSSSQACNGKLGESDDSCSESNLNVSCHGAHDCSRPSNCDDDLLNEAPSTKLRRCSLELNEKLGEIQRMPGACHKEGDKFHIYLEEAMKAAEALERLVSVEENGMPKDDSFVDDVKCFMSGCEAGRRLLERQPSFGR